jgi:hypothetical protein
MKQSIDYETFRASNMTWGEYMYLSDWCKPKRYISSELNIGQMIEFLDEKGKFEMRKDKNFSTNGPDVWYLTSDDAWILKGGCEELCDCLWLAVVDICRNRKEKA